MIHAIKNSLRVAGATTLAVALSAAAARPASEDLRATIAFSFLVNDKTMPPGTYTISVDNQQGVVELRDFKHGAFALALPFDDSSSQERKLVFHRYGDEYVLREIWTGEGTGRELLEPRRERALAEASTSAGRTASPQTVAVAAR
jgi:hypothetical protein